jgi:hypothetical protein
MTLQRSRKCHRKGDTPSKRQVHHPQRRGESALAHAYLPFPSRIRVVAPWSFDGEMASRLAEGPALDRRLTARSVRLT